MKRLCWLTGFLLLFTTAGYAQTNFKAALEAADPVPKGSAMTASEKFSIHESYLKQAVASKDLRKQLYAAIYLGDDKQEMQDYPNFARYIIQAENLAAATEDKSCQGFVKIKLGWVDFIVHEDMQSAIKKVQVGAKLCTDAKDTLCAAECLEQVATMYSNLGLYDSAHYYFELVIPVLKKFANGNLASAYNNYTNLLAFEGHSAQALPFIDSAIAIAQKEHNTRTETFYLTNRALLLYEIKRYPEALLLLQKCIAINGKNGWLDNLVFDYDDIAAVYYETGKYKLAYEFSGKYHDLHDSLSGASVKNKVTNLILQNEQQQKELALKKSQLDLAQSRYSVHNRNIIIAAILILGVSGIAWGWYRLQSRKQKLVQHQKSLASLTQLLLQKNSQLTAMQEQLDEATAPQPEPPMETTIATELPVENTTNDPSLYNQRILTHADWNTFKIHFEKAYPGYLARLRTAFSTLSEAEERLFLFIKLNLKNTEIADILGITADSVKKTRTRLRKRLELPPEEQTDDFIKRF